MFREANKIWPTKSAIPIIASFFLVGSLIIVGSSLLDKRKKKNDYYRFHIDGKVEKYIVSKNYNFYKINGNWFGIQGMLNTHIRQSDSLIKTQNSYDIIVISSNGDEDNYQYPYTFFKMIDENDRLRKYFIANVDTLDTIE